MSFHRRFVALGVLFGGFALQGLAQDEAKTAITLASPTIRPDNRGYLTILLTNGGGISISQLEHWIEVPAGKITYISSRSGIAADLASAQVQVEAEDREDGGLLLHVLVKSEKALPDGPLVEVTFDVGKLVPETLKIPHRMEALDTAGAMVSSLNFSDWELKVAEELPEAPPAIFSCFFYMHP